MNKEQQEDMREKEPAEVDKETWDIYICEVVQSSPQGSFNIALMIAITGSGIGPKS